MPDSPSACGVAKGEKKDPDVTFWIFRHLIRLIVWVCQDENGSWWNRWEHDGTVWQVGEGSLKNFLGVVVFGHLSSYIMVMKVILPDTVLQTPRSAKRTWILF